ncbi:MAG TPA: hypothetical protein DD706_20015 [Nitrospiraceae bacterium]|nr:hypothetical protein [Nitrospiraceae bacterium]
MTSVEGHGKNPLRNHVILLFSPKAGHRSKEIAAFQWSVVTEGKGNLLDATRTPESKVIWNGPFIPLHRQLYVAIAFLM